VNRKTGAICEECGRDMMNSRGCDHTHFLHPDGTIHRRNTVDLDDCGSIINKNQCRDCGAKRGGFHHAGCDTESCPRCGGQALGCRCTDDFLAIPLKLHPNTEKVRPKWVLPAARPTGAERNLKIRRVCADLRRVGYRRIVASEVRALLKDKNAPFSCANLAAMALLFGGNPSSFISIEKATGKQPAR